MRQQFLAAAQQKAVGDLQKEDVMVLVAGKGVQLPIVQHKHVVCFQQKTAAIPLYGQLPAQREDALDALIGIQSPAADPLQADRNPFNLHGLASCVSVKQKSTVNFLQVNLL